MRCMKLSQKKEGQQQKVSACVFASLFFLEELIVVLVIYLCLSLNDTVGEEFQVLASNLSENRFTGCRTKVSVVHDEATEQIWDSCSLKFSKAWSTPEQNLKGPAEKYMEKTHSLALYLFTQSRLEQGKGNSESGEKTLKPRRTFGPFSLYSSLTQVIQILKQNQVICLTTKYRTENVLKPNISTGQVRFSTFILGSDRWSLDRNGSCYEIYSCFGANITKYSALKGHNQVLIPPYEVFTATYTQKQNNSCKVSYKLQSNLHCVYDKELNQLHSISALPVEGFWLIFTIICFILLFFLLLCVIVKFYHKMNSSHRIMPSYNITQSHYGF